MKGMSPLTISLLQPGVMVTPTDDADPYDQSTNFSKGTIVDYDTNHNIAIIKTIDGKIKKVLSASYWLNIV